MQDSVTVVYIKTWRLQKLDSATDLKNILQVRYFHKQQLRGILRNNPIYTFRNFQGLWPNSFIVRVVSSVYSESLTFYGKKLQWRSYLLEGCPRRRLQNRYSYKDFRKFTGKHLYQIQYLMKLQTFSLELFCKRDPSADVFLLNLWNI